MRPSPLPALADQILVTSTDGVMSDSSAGLFGLPSFSLSNQPLTVEQPPSARTQASATQRRRPVEAWDRADMSVRRCEVWKGVIRTGSRSWGEYRRLG